VGSAAAGKGGAVDSSGSSSPKLGNSWLEARGSTQHHHILAIMSQTGSSSMRMDVVTVEESEEEQEEQEEESEKEVRAQRGAYAASEWTRLGRVVG
jgi:hypothetical protein